MRLNLDKAEWHNIVSRNGVVQTRPGFAYVVPSISSSYKYMAGFTIQSPNTQEPWHYLIGRYNDTAEAWLEVKTEESQVIFSVLLGELPDDISVSYAVVNRQIIINSPSFSAPLYGHVGGGLIPAHKIESENPLATARDIPVGHVCEFGGRVVIAEGSRLHFNEPRSDADIRTFTDGGVIALPGKIHQLVTASNGNLYIFTSAGTYTLPADAAGKGNDPTGYLGTVTTIPSLGPQCAAVSMGTVAYLTATGVAFIGGGEPVDIWKYKGKRYNISSLAPSGVLDMSEDIRRNARIYASAEGFWVSLRGPKISFEVNLAQGYASTWIHKDAAGGNSNILGILRSFEGDTFPLTSEGAVMFVPGRAGNQYASHSSGSEVSPHSRICIDVPDGPDERAKNVTIHAQNGLSLGTHVNGATIDSTCAIPAQSSVAIIGTSTWNQASTALTMRTSNSVKVPIGVRAASMGVEITASRGSLPIHSVDIEIGGQGRNRQGGSA